MADHDINMHDILTLWLAETFPLLPALHVIILSLQNNMFTYTYTINHILGDVYKSYVWYVEL